MKRAPKKAKVIQFPAQKRAPRSIFEEIAANIARDRKRKAAERKRPAKPDGGAA